MSTLNVYIYKKEKKGEVEAVNKDMALIGYGKLRESIKLENKN